MMADQFKGGKSRVGMSGIGGVAATQAVIDLCATNDIKPDIKVVPVEELNAIYAQLDSGDAGAVRYVLDIAGTLNEDASARCRDKPPPKLSPFINGISVPAVVKEACWLICCCKT